MNSYFALPVNSCITYIHFCSLEKEGRHWGQAEFMGFLFRNAVHGNCFFFPIFSLVGQCMWTQFSVYLEAKTSKLVVSVA